MWNAAERSDKIRTDCLLNLLKKKKKKEVVDPGEKFQLPCRSRSHIAGC